MFAAIIQARVGSTRLPNKTFARLAGKPLIWHVVDRLKFSKNINKIIVATTILPEDNLIEDWCVENNCSFFRGSEDNVLNRFYETAKCYDVENIVRITADDPFKDPEIIDRIIELFLSNKLDFAYNNNPPTFPEGLDTEVFSFKALETANKFASNPFEKEHVTQYFYKNLNLFKSMNYTHSQNLSYLRWTIDTEKDLDMARKVYKELYVDSKIFLMHEILHLIKEKPHLGTINSDVKRSAMYNNN